MNEKELDLFENMPIGKAVRSLAIPTIISQLVMLAYNLADTFFLGQTGDSRQVAAVTLCFPIFMMIGTISNLFGIGGGSLASRLLGEKKAEKAGRVSTFVLWGGAVTAGATAVIVSLLMPRLLGMLGADENTYGYAAEYIRYTVVIGGVPSVLNQILAQLTRAKGNAKAASFGVSMGGIINIVLDPILILGLGMDVAGAALATCISNAIAMVYYLILFHRTRDSSLFETRLFAGLPERACVRQIFSIGTPAALTVFLASVSNSLMMNLMSGYSPSAIAGLGIAQRIELIPFYVVQGISSGVLPLLAYNYASGNHERMDDAVKTALRSGIVIAAAAFVVIEITAPYMVRGFIADTDTIVFGSSFTRLRCLALPFITVEFMLIAVFQGIGSARQAFVLSFFRKGIFDLPVLLLLNRLWPLYGLMLVQPLMELMGSILAARMYRKQRGRQGGQTGLFPCKKGKKQEYPTIGGLKKVGLRGKGRMDHVTLNNGVRRPAPGLQEDLR